MEDWTPPAPPPPLSVEQKAAALPLIARLRGVPCEMNNGTEALGAWWMCATYKLDPKPVGPIVWAWVGPTITSDPSALVVEGFAMTRANLRALLAEITPNSGLALIDVVQVIVKADGAAFSLSTIQNGDPQGQRRELLPHLHPPRFEHAPDGLRLAFFATDSNGTTRRFTCLVDGDGGLGLQPDAKVPPVPGRGVFSVE